MSTNKFYEKDNWIIGDFKKNIVDRMGFQNDVFIHFEAEKNWYDGTIWANIASSKSTDNDTVVEMGYIYFNITNTNWTWSEFCGNDGVIIEIEDIKVKEQYRNNGVGKELFMTLINDIMPIYFEKMKKSVQNIFVVGELAIGDYMDGNWEKSIPFYLSLENRILQENSIFDRCRTLIGFDLNEEFEEFLYDSKDLESINRYGNLKFDEYINQLIKELIEEEIGSKFVCFHFQTKTQ